jgi:hypothetical protein
MYTLEHLQQKTFGELKAIGWELNVFPEDDRRRRESWINAIAGVNPPLLQLLEVSPGVEVDRTQEPIIETVATSPAADNVQAQEPPIESKFGRIVYPRPAQGAIVPVAENSPAVEVDRVSEPIVPAAKTSPGVEVDRVPEPIVPVAENPPGVEVDRVPEPIVPVAENFLDADAPKCSECFDDGFIEDEFGSVKICQCNNEPKLSRQKTQSAIAPAAENLPRSESDLNPILTGIALSDRFLARYSRPQSEVFQFQADADGQLTLIDFKIQSAPEPPDPDDFASIEEFQEALARWDAQNPEPLAVSMDSMCEWAPCPEEWYEPEAESLPLKASSMMELSPPAIENSSTSDFSIPTFDAWCDRANRQTDTDEPPDTGIFARLPNPKPPKFPPQAASQPRVTQVSRNYPETIPKLFHRVVAGSTQPARSPPGGDAMS